MACAVQVLDYMHFSQLTFQNGFIKVNVYCTSFGKMFHQLNSRLRMETDYSPYVFRTSFQTLFWNILNDILTHTHRHNVYSLDHILTLAHTHTHKHAYTCYCYLTFQGQCVWSRSSRPYTTPGPQHSNTQHSTVKCSAPANVLIRCLLASDKP